MHPFTHDPAEGFELEDGALTEDFDHAVDYLLRSCPVARNRRDGYWMVSRLEDVKACAQDWETFSSAQGIRPNRNAADAILIPVELDPPEHTRWRTAIFPYFTKDAVAEHRSGIEAAADGLIDALATTGSCDMAERFANPFPGVAFFNEVLGVPAEDAGHLGEVMHQANYGDPDERTAAWGDMAVYVDGYLRLRKTESPRGDLVDAILALEFPDSEVSWDQRVSAVSLLISGGLDTTAHVLGGALWHLGLNPDVQDRLRADPSAIPRAVEEYLRYFASAFAIGRTTTRDVEIGTTDIPAGDMVMLGFAAACRDPEHVDDPMTCDTTREGNRHIAFGLGPHRCVGAHLARMELVVALERILARLRDLRVPDPDAVQFRTRMMRVVETLPMTYDVA